jgi:DNA polymerase III subunit epsilon
MKFAVIDLETANEDLASICQVGIASFCDGVLTEGWKTLVDPDDYFSPVNISIHGIDEQCVRGAPRFPDILPEVSKRLSGCITVSHTPFDRSALRKACERCDEPTDELTWLDSARVVRRAWPQFAKSGYGLSNVASFLQIHYQAHDALEDARCAGIVLLRAIADTGISLEEWLVRARRPIEPRYKSVHSAAAEASSDGDLNGEVLVFTGALSIPRREAADAAVAAGCRIDDGVTKHTTILVVGDQDLRRLAVHEKSSKHLKAEALILKGQRIRILCETDFMQIVSQ